MAGRSFTTIQASTWYPVSSLLGARYQVLLYAITCNGSDPVFAGAIFGTSRSGIGLPLNSFAHAIARYLVYFFVHATRALSVARPVSAYIWRYTFDISRNASRPRTSV